MKETFGQCERRAEQHYYILVRATCTRAYLFGSSVLGSVEGRVWAAHITITCVSGWWTTLLDASWYRVDSRLVAIDEQEMLIVCYQVS